MMAYQGLRIARSILFRVFLIGFLFLILAWFCLIFGKAYWTDLLMVKWHIGNPALIDILIIAFFALAKFVLFFYVLIPAIAISWTLCKLDKQQA
ncbi:MAG TPA: hypothetical protein V6C99_05275 [Oculatellaceae cyanobacterium]